MAIPGKGGAWRVSLSDLPCAASRLPGCDMYPCLFDFMPPERADSPRESARAFAVALAERAGALAALVGAAVEISAPVSPGVCWLGRVASSAGGWVTVRLDGWASGAELSRYDPREEVGGAFNAAALVDARLEDARGEVAVCLDLRRMEPGARVVARARA